PARPAGGLRPAPPRGPAPRGGGRDARHPGRDRSVAIALRDANPTCRLRCGARAGHGTRRTTGIGDRLFERAVRDWLGDGSDRTPRHAIDGVLFAIKTTPQQRALRIPWRFPTMNPITRLAAVAAVATVAIAGSLYLFGRSPGNAGGPP